MSNIPSANQNRAGEPSEPIIIQGRGNPTKSDLTINGGGEKKNLPADLEKKLIDITLLTKTVHHILVQGDLVFRSIRRVAVSKRAKPFRHLWG